MLHRCFSFRLSLLLDTRPSSSRSGIPAAASDDRRAERLREEASDTSCAGEDEFSGQYQLDLDEQSANDVKVERPLR